MFDLIIIFIIIIIVVFSKLPREGVLNGDPNQPELFARDRPNIEWAFNQKPNPSGSIPSQMPPETKSEVIQPKIEPISLPPLKIDLAPDDKEETPRTAPRGVSFSPRILVRTFNKNNGEIIDQYSRNT